MARERAVSVQLDAGAAEAFDVVVVGGGAAGALVLIRLLHAAGPPLRIAVVEPRAKLAEGIAYSTTRPEHLLNVRAAGMTAIDGEPAHFVRFLADDPANAGIDAAELGLRFARRAEYARYLRATLARSPGFADVHWLSDEAVDILRGDGGWHVQLASGARVGAGRVVLAIGNEPRALPLPVVAAAPGRVLDAWDYAAVGGITQGEAVCIVGSGLSMVDALATLAASGHAGPVTVLSRHGLVPLPHALPGPAHGVVDDLLALGMRARMRALRRRARDQLRAGQPWQWTMDALRHHGEALWRNADTAERARFLRHVARYWDIHRHRIAPEAAALLDAASAAGRLRVRAGRLTAVEDAGDGLGVHFRERGGGEQALHVAHVINATGLETAFQRSRRPLLRAMRQRGLLRPGPLGLGIATGEDGAVLDAEGAVLPGLFTLGSLRIGDLWESIAVPELRVQARRIVERLRTGSPAGA